MKRVVLKNDSAEFLIKLKMIIRINSTYFLISSYRKQKMHSKKNKPDQIICFFLEQKTMSFKQMKNIVKIEEII